MIKIQKLDRPNKHSGYALEPGKTTKIKGMTITNTTNFVVYIDRYTRKHWQKKKQSGE